MAKKHKVETEFHFEPFADGQRARCNISVKVDGKDVGFLTVLSGPIKEVKAYYDRKMTLDEVQMRWADGK